MPKKKDLGFWEKVGPLAFILGIVFVVVAAMTKYLYWWLGGLGLIVGLMNISDKELTKYLLASLTFLMSANALSVTLSKMIAVFPILSKAIEYIDPFLANITLFVAPGAAVVAMKALYSLSKD